MIIRLLVVLALNSAYSSHIEGLNSAHAEFMQAEAVYVESTLVSEASIFDASLSEDIEHLYQQAIELYNAKMYDRAKELFKQCGTYSLSEDYLTLCAIHLDSRDCSLLVELADVNRAKSFLNSEIHREYALALFEQSKYELALANLEKVNLKTLTSLQLGEYWYKKGYCLSENALRLTEALNCLKNSVEYQSEYKYPAYFAMGLIEYNFHNFAQARHWFENSINDMRFADISAFYLVDCHFMAGDYSYVIEKGEILYPTVSAERQKHLSRMLSESFMLKGDAKSARKYLSVEKAMSYADYFHAGSVLYAVGDYKGAIENFEKMSPQKDSLYQIASYQKAYSYVTIKNKVKALDSFKDASELSFDNMIKEDALFNYAKLSFDLNNDESVFKQYISTYGTTVKGEMIFDYLAMSALLKKDYTKAVEAYDNIDELSDSQKSNYIKANYLRADQLLKIGSYSSAIPYLKAASYYLPKDNEFGQLSRYTLANTYYMSDSYKDALNVYNDLYNITALYGRSEGALIPYNIAYCFFKQRDYSNAARWFDTYLSSGDKLARKDALIRRADCDFSVKNYKSAALNYKKAVDAYKDVQNLYSYYYMGMSYGLLGDKKAKVQALSIVLSCDATAQYYLESMYELARAYTDISEGQNALKAFDILLSHTSDPEFVAKALLGKGVVKHNMGNLQDALKEYQSLVKKLPSSPYVQDALLSIQSIYTALKQPEKYIEYLEANNLSTGRTPEEKRALYFNTAQQVFLAGNYKGAINSFNKYLNMYPNSEKTSDAYYYIAASYKSLSQKEKACEYYAKVLSLGVESSSYAEFAIMDYALLSYSLERYKQAYDLYMKLTSKQFTMISKADAYTGAMRSAYRASDYTNAIDAAAYLLRIVSDADLRREAQYVQAKSYLSTSQRDKAFELLTKLMTQANTAEGAESYYLIIKARFDWGKFEEVEKGVFDFAQKNEDQPYWLAKAFIVLGDSYVERNMLDQAIATYQSVRDGYEASSSEDDILTLVQQKLTDLE